MRNPFLSRCTNPVEKAPKPLGRPLGDFKLFGTASLFVAVCGVVSTSGGAPLFSDDLENGLGQWIGKYGGTGSAVTVADPLNSGHGGVLQFTAVTVAGDIFSKASFSVPGPFRISFDHLGNPGLGVGFLGVAYSVPPYIGEGYDNFWYAASQPNPTAIIMLVNDGSWHHYDIQVDGTTLTRPFYLMAEDWSGGGGAAGNSFFDNISLTVVPEPSAPVLGSIALGLCCLARTWAGRSGGARKKAKKGVDRTAVGDRIRSASILA